MMLKISAVLKGFYQFWDEVNGMVVLYSSVTSVDPGFESSSTQDDMLIECFLGFPVKLNFNLMLSSSLTGFIGATYIGIVL